MGVGTGCGGAGGGQRAECWQLRAHCCSLLPDTVGGDPMGLPYSTFDHSRAHYFRYDEHVSLCLEKQR